MPSQQGYWLLETLAGNYGRLSRRNAEFSEIPGHITGTPEFRLVLFRPEPHEFRPKRRNSGDSGVSHRNAETGIHSQALYFNFTHPFSYTEKNVTCTPRARPEAWCLVRLLAVVGLLWARSLASLVLIPVLSL